jgi:diguanylate cyclase (GGDEF)-like protein
MIEKEIVGILNINDVAQGSVDVDDLEFILNLSEIIAMSVSNAVLYEQARTLAVTDGLTGISNRQYLDKSLLIEFERSTRYDTPLSLVLLDVDNFKDVNDTYGHQRGDDVLVAVASLLKKFCRTNDIASRYGGEEFLMVLPQSNAQGAFKIAERIREEIMKLNFDEDESVFSVTISCGVAELNKDYMENVDQLVDMTDKALYKAKNGGRNKTVVGKTENKR